MGIEEARNLKQQLVEELESLDPETDSRKHELNLLIRDLEEELDYIESSKLADFDPERS